ncbi:caspase recruitment domain-containing protein 18-like [Otolemur garnettii]|uniref:caspase recruitment domain-containing protein 18-like n=1 Tax=Otolemur garnettii TaxID=30611 RepID=UPI000C7EC1BF|nr:caspase recruitment domain-containing protein 18-like [Otolemur garnettii]
MYIVKNDWLGKIKMIASLLVNCYDNYLKNLCVSNRPSPGFFIHLFIHSVSEGIINCLLDDLLEDKVINQEEMCKVKYENHTVMDKARVLIDIVIGKGPGASRSFIKHLHQEDHELARKLHLPSVCT